MGLKLIDLLRWSREVIIKDQDGKDLLADGKPVHVWLRIIGDQDLETAFKAARAESARLRDRLRDRESDEYLSEISGVVSADRQSAMTIITSVEQRNITSLAYANTERPDTPKIEQIAVDPDAPTLEEQEKLDTLIIEVNKEYTDSVAQYVADQLAATTSELSALSDEVLKERLIEATIDLRCLERFMKVLEAEKCWRSVYLDKYLKERAFSNREEWNELSQIIKGQIILAYTDLELDPEEVKN